MAEGGRLNDLSKQHNTFEKTGNESNVSKEFENEESQFNERFTRSTSMGSNSSHSSDNIPNYGRLNSEPDDDRKRQKALLIRDAKEIADLIIGCQTALDCFMSFYDEWAVNRAESISLMEKLVGHIEENSKQSEKVKDILEKISRVSSLADEIPHREASLATKIAATISSFIAKLFGGGNSKKDIQKQQFEIKEIFQKDIDTSSLSYIYGIQCLSQFDETRKLIREFHEKIRDDYDTIMEDEDVLEFLSEISDYNPTNERIFYKRLRLCYEKLIANAKTRESKSFIRVFQDMPTAVQVINQLAWRFDTDGFDHSIVSNAWEEMFQVFYTENASVNDFLAKIQNCLFFLKKERTIFERTVLNLLQKKMN